MKRISVAALAGALLLVGPAVGVSRAADAPWQALNAVQATALDADEMNGVSGKATMSLFDFLKQNGQSYSVGTGSVMVWTSVPGAPVVVSGSFGSGVVVYK